MLSSDISSRPTESRAESSSTPPLSRFELSGPSAVIDRRIQAARADLTDVRLADRIFAPHYAAPVVRSATTILPVRAAPEPDAIILSELLPGDAFELLEWSTGKAWGRSVTDSVVGYVDPAGLTEHAAATHRVVALAAPLREAPDANAGALATLPMGARVVALGERGAFLLTDHGYVAADDVAPIDARGPSGVAAAALRLLGVPAREGGRSGSGVDATGLVFLACDCAGIAAPRFLDLQRSTLGSPLDESEALVAGDLLFHDEDVAIMVSADEAVRVDGSRVVRVPLAALTGSVRARRRTA